MQAGSDLSGGLGVHAGRSYLPSRLCQFKPMTIPATTEPINTHVPTVLLGMNQYPTPPRIVERMSETMTRIGVGPEMINSTRNAMKSSKNASGMIERLTNEAKRPRLHRGDERSRDSEKLRENGRQCRRGPT